ncbi:MAG: tripartite tricarboxylate transporter substrate binding protein [Pigmentiphaga sp.]|nr:tripartite tricarboxylate transporter substrate binding protein [Pigmentiphaga sp.]
MYQYPRGRRWTAGALFAGLMAAFAMPAGAASDYPQKPISLVVPFAAGGSLDATARIIGDKADDILGQQIIIINRPGAGSSVGARSVASADPDGYTMLIASGSAYGYMHMLIPGYDLTLADFEPIAVVAVNPSVIVSSASLGVDSLEGLVDYVAKHPGKVSFCSTGVGGLNHLQLEMFKEVVKADTGKDFAVEHIPYNGLAPAVVGLVGKEVQACTLPYTAMVKERNGTDLNILAVQSPSRIQSMPDVPTTGEAGFKEMDSNDAFVNITAPKGTPPEVIAKLEAAIQQAMEDPAVLEKLHALDIQTVFMGSKETGDWLKEDVAKYEKLIKGAGLAVEKK